jgi:hypothetical protein
MVTDVIFMVRSDISFRWSVQTTAKSSDRMVHTSREKLWRRFVEDIILERDNPAAAARRGRLTSSSRTARGPHLNDASGTVTDKAYEREYLAHDRKRIRRD